MVTILTVTDVVQTVKLKKDTIAQVVVKLEPIFALTEDP